MNKLYAFLLIIFPFINQAQDKSITPFPVQISNYETEQNHQIQMMSPTTAFMLLDYSRVQNHSLSETEFIEKHGATYKQGALYINAFVHVHTEFVIDKLISKGFLPGVKTGYILTGLIPLQKFQEILSTEGVDYIDIGNKTETYLDSSKIQTFTDSVHLGAYPLSRSYKGSGVIVGVIDIGFDYTHPNFYDSTGSNGYRVKRVWEQRKSGTPPSGFAYGRELTTQANILSAQTDLTNQTHGSHVAGISAGAGVNNYTLIGAAPKSDLVLVATTMQTADIADGIAYIENYAASVGKPCVINMSLGSVFGKHDGTGSFSQLCDNSFIKDGNILVVAAGNDGASKMHIKKKLNGVIANDSVFHTFIEFPGAANKVAGETYVDAWGEVGDTFYIGIGIYNKVTDTYEDFSPYLYNASTSSFNSITLTDDAPTPRNCYVDFYCGTDAVNKRPRLTMVIDNRTQTSADRQLLIYVKSLKSSTINMWTRDAKSSFVNNGYTIEEGNSEMTINELATGKKIISVGAYTSRVFWTPYGLPSSNYRYTSFSYRGNAAVFTSRGPTIDGRTKPEISAPGTAIISSYNSYINNASYTNSATSVIITHQATSGAKSWHWGVMQGTSMATPFATGIIALWLEMYPQLNYTHINKIFEKTAIRDAFTGAPPPTGDNIFGIGKINAFVGVLPLKPSLNHSDTVFICNGDKVEIKVNESFHKYEWNNGAITSSILVSSPGFYFVRGTNEYGITGDWSDTVWVKKSDLDLNLGNDTLLCHNASITLNAKNIGATYKWNDNSTSRTKVISQAGKFWVSVSKDGCTVSDTIKISESDLELNLGNDTIFCHNTVINLDAQNIGATYKWNDNSTGKTLTVSQTGKYWVEVSKDGCLISDSIQITESDLELELGNDTIFCHNTVVNLDAQNIGATYKWNDNSTGKTLIVSQTGKYWVDVFKDACMISDSIQITESDLELELGNDTIFCHNTVVNLDAQNIGATYKWNDNSTGKTLTVSQTGKYWVNVFKDGCMISDSISITESDLELELGNDTIFCHNTVVNLDAQNIGATYKWNDNSTGKTLTVSQTGKYWVDVFKDGCMISDSISITESDLELELGNDTIFCHNTVVNLDAQNIGATYKWNDNSTGKTLTVSQTGKYWVDVFKDGCMISDSILITESDLELELGNDTSFCEGITLVLESNNINAHHEWRSELNSAISTDSRFEVTESGKYWVVISKDNCTISDTISVVVHPLPKAIELISNKNGLCSFDFELTNPTHTDFYIWNFGDNFSDTLTNIAQHSFRENNQYKVNVSIVNACGSREYETMVNCSGLDNKNILRLSPNPAQDIIKLSLNSYVETIKEVRITNSLGQYIFTEEKDLGSETLVNITEFASGVYNVMVISNEGNKYIQKFVKSE